MSRPLPRWSPPVSPRSDARRAPQEWRSTRPERPLAPPPASELTLRSLAAGVILLFVLGVAILAAAEMAIEGLRWVRDFAAVAAGGAA